MTEYEKDLLKDTVWKDRQADAYQRQLDEFREELEVAALKEEEER